MSHREPDNNSPFKDAVVSFALVVLPFGVAVLVGLHFLGGIGGSASHGEAGGHGAPAEHAAPAEAAPAH